MKKTRFSLQPFPFILLLTALVTGILLQDNLPRIPFPFWLAGLMLFTASSLLLHSLPSKLPGRGPYVTLLLLPGFVFLGGTVCHLQDESSHTTWYGRHLDQTQALKIQLDEAPVEKPKTLLLKASVRSVAMNDHWLDAKGKLWVYVYKKDIRKQFAAGQTLIIPNKLVPIRASGNPFAFDQKKYANRNGLFHQCFLSDKEIWLTGRESAAPGFIMRLRTSIQNAISNNIKDETTKALVLATVANDRTQLEPKLIDAYSTTGTIHIIAISGMHIILLAAIILFIMERIPVRPVQHGKHLLAMVLAWIYIAMTGFPPSAVRAGVMFSIYAIGNTLNRDSQQVNTWAASGLLLLCYNPYWIYDVGFQLSFLAVLSILLFTKSITAWWQPANSVLNVLWKAIAVGLSVQILVFPLVIYYFNQFPLLGFVANIPAGFFSTVLMIGTMLLIIINSLGFSAIYLGKLLTLLTQWFHYILFLLAKLSPESLKSLYIDAIDYWIIMAIITALCVFLYFKSAMQLFAALAFSIVLIAGFIGKDRLASMQERIIVYNTANESAVSVIKGKKIYHLYLFSGQTYKYALKPAMLGFRTSYINPANGIGHIFHINGKRILIYGPGNIQSGASFPVDVLVVSDNCVFEPKKWLKTFRPGWIIIDGSLPRWKAAKWKETLVKAGVKVRWVQDSGAWVYPAP